MKRTEIVQRMTDLLEERKTELCEARILTPEEEKDLLRPGGHKRWFDAEKHRYKKKLASKDGYEVVGTQDGVIALTKNGQFVASGDFDRGADAFFMDLPKARKPAWNEAQDIVDYAAANRLKPE